MIIQKKQIIGSGSVVDINEKSGNYNPPPPNPSKQSAHREHDECGHCSAVLMKSPSSSSQHMGSASHSPTTTGVPRNHHGLRYCCLLTTTTAEHGREMRRSPSSPVREHVGVGARLLHSALQTFGRRSAHTSPLRHDRDLSATTCAEICALSPTIATTGFLPRPMISVQ